jgi:hypothetical protein
MIPGSAQEGFSVWGMTLRMWWPLTLVMAASAMWAVLFYFQGDLHPFEDAAMLLRYSEHVASGQGIIWNPGGAPVDGATDFLFMMMVAGLSRLGLDVMGAARLLTLCAHAVTIAYVYRMHILRPSGTAVAAGLSALVVATGPGLHYCEALFGTTVFALAGLVTYRHFLRMIEDDARTATATGFALAGIVTGLVRPEGVFLVAGMVASLLWHLRGAVRRVLVQRVLILFCLPGLVYFGWHWLYFGHPLPNPFYVKGGGSLYPSSLRASFMGVVKMGSVLLPFMAWAAWKRDSRRKTLLLYAPIFLFAVAWILMSNAMNYCHRFQYILMPIMWVAWLPVVEGMRPGFSLRGRWLTVGLPLGASVLLFHYLAYASQPRTLPDGKVDLGKALSRWEGKGYSMAITEAGNLPFFSRWRAVDAWGLNDAHIAHRGRVDAGYLDAYRPALLMIHDYWSPGAEKLRPDPAWAEMTDSLEEYADGRGYELVASWGRHSQSTLLYYLRKDLPDFDTLCVLISNFPFYWTEDGDLAENFLKCESGKGNFVKETAF